MKAPAGAFLLATVVPVQPGTTVYRPGTRFQLRKRPHYPVAQRADGIFRLFITLRAVPLRLD
jgi:hypothetical protein